MILGGLRVIQRDNEDLHMYRASKKLEFRLRGSVTKTWTVKPRSKTWEIEEISLRVYNLFTKQETPYPCYPECSPDGGKAYQNELHKLAQIGLVLTHKCIHTHAYTNTHAYTDTHDLNLFTWGSYSLTPTKPRDFPLNTDRVLLMTRKTVNFLPKV